ncbi:FtsK/SpoIIIE protein [Bacillus phage Silence]|nr:FtsK/SpoIIIE protein [Bacillus phage Silence]
MTAKMKMNGENKMSDHEKIIAIANECNLKTKKDSIHLHKKRPQERYTEYVYRIPHGLSYERFADKLNEFNDGMNIKKRERSFTWKGLKELRAYIQDKQFSRDSFIDDLNGMFFIKNDVNKRVTISFDGMLKFKVFDKPVPLKVDFDESFLEGCTDWKIPLGDNGEEVLKWKIGREHMAIAGGTRQGKSQFTKLLIATLIKLYPDMIKFSFFDLKGGVTMDRFKNLEQTQHFAESAEDSMYALDAIYEEMMEIQAYCKSKGVETADEAGLYTKHFVVIDEAAELSPEIKKNRKDELKYRRQCEMRLSEIARLGAGFNIILIFSTQYPTADVMNKDIKSNIGQVVCFKLRSGRQSQTVLDKWGAEKLEAPGRALVIDGVINHKVQVPLIDNDYISRIIGPHIVIKSREDVEHEKTHEETGKNGEDTLIIEDAWDC